MRQTRIEVRHVVAVVSALLILVGIYAKLFYDVPDAQELTNMWVSWFIIIMGAVGIAFSLLWKVKRNPVTSEN